jgi:uncharacterized protein (PEP-CTERM system associated)
VTTDDDTLNRPGSAERFISKRLDWSLIFELRRTKINLAVFDEERSARTSADGDPFPDQSQRGGNVGLEWQLGTRTDLNISAGFTNRKEEGFADTDFLNASTELGYKIGKKSRLSLHYSHTDEQPNLPSSGRDYVANIVTLFFTYTL